MLNILELIDTLGKDTVAALSAFHAFTGSDYTASFINKGKVRPFDSMEKSKLFISTFAAMGEENNDPLPIMEQFVCKMYGHPKASTANEARYKIFLKKYAPKKNEEPLEKLKGLNPNSMPPCKSVLINKLKGVEFVVRLWKRAMQPVPCSQQPTDHGWYVDDNGRYAPRWYDGSQVPDVVCQALTSSNADRAMTEAVDEITFDEGIYGEDEDVGDEDFDE